MRKFVHGSVISVNVRELLSDPTHGVRPYPPYNEAFVEIRPRIIKPGEPDGYILTEAEAVKQFGDRHVWLAFHDEGTMEQPLGGEHVYAICID